MVLNESLPAADSIIKSGRARFLGITGYPVSVLDEISERSTVRIYSVLSYCRLTMFDDTLKSYIPRFKVYKCSICFSFNIGFKNQVSDILPL